MAMIILSLGDVVLREIRLSKERMSIGRGRRNDIVIDNPAISGEHAVIVTTDTDAFLEDLNSTNGTQINGQPIRKHYLQDGDVIALAQYRIRYAVDEHVTEKADTSGALGVIKILNGAAQGKEIALTQVLTTIGRPGMQVALITRSTDGYSITHVEGKAYPLVNGEPVGDTARSLVKGDAIELSGTVMQFMVN